MDCFFRRRPLLHWRSFIVRRGCGFARFFGGLTCYFFSLSSDRGVFPKTKASGAKQIFGGRRGRHWPICRQAPGCIFAHFSPSRQSGSLPAQSSRFIYFAADAKKSQQLASPSEWLRSVFA